MTTERKYIVDAADLQTVRFECRACGASMSYRTKDWTQTPFQCPACGVQWVQADGSKNHPVNRLSEGLREAIASALNARYRVRFEIQVPNE